ncbi:hypothetical protein H2198_004960 [Neophaeococcomyces mojaviensis]|uniref:Uncharacterized protein n=1 Tax=Neophaeococcomyces mojaviensis TaxID=3383035 RepID=A0ACC3A782_9EURO|nr:hypothetical protein H2198_004960 [Knufia sp. JES_112]
MKIYQSSTDYSYSFPTVSLAYFLRYPNPYSKHVLSTDTISQYIDPTTQRLHTLRLHLKRSKVPAGILKFLPSGMSGPGGASQSYILEKSVVDVKEGWMETESRNMEWTGILSVVENAVFRDKSLSEIEAGTGTSCQTTVTFVSKIGQTLMKRRKTAQVSEDSAGQQVEVEEEQPKQGFFASWSTAGIQRTIELIGVKRSKTALVNSAEGMKIVLERMRNGGIKGVLEGMRHDRIEMMAMHGLSDDGTPSWKQVWNNGNRHRDDHDDHDE